MTLRYKPGDVVRVVRAGRAEYIGLYVTILWAGPWVVGDEHPNGLLCFADNDYIASDPLYPENHEGVALRESNLE